MATASPNRFLMAPPGQWCDPGQPSTQALVVSMLVDPKGSGRPSSVADGCCLEERCRRLASGGGLTFAVPVERTSHLWDSASRGTRCLKISVLLRFSLRLLRRRAAVAAPLNPRMSPSGTRDAGPFSLSGYALKGPVSDAAITAYKLQRELTPVTHSRPPLAMRPAYSASHSRPTTATSSSEVTTP